MMENPINTSFEKDPVIDPGSDIDVKKLTDELDNINSPYQTTLVYGTIGTKNTKLITAVSNVMSLKKNWMIANLDTKKQLMQALISCIYNNSDKAFQQSVAFMKGIRVTASGIRISDENGDAPQSQYLILLKMMLEKLKESNIHLLITIDEIRDTPDLKQFVSMYQLLIRKGYCISLIIVGSPQIIQKLQNDTDLTFLLRAKQISLNTAETKSSMQDVKLCSLVEFKTDKGVSVRNDAKYDKQYLEGKHGAVSYMKNAINWENMHG